MIAVALAAMLFAVLVLVVRAKWTPLLSFDLWVARQGTSMIGPHPWLVAVVKAVTRLGGGPVLWPIVLLVAVVLLVRRQIRLAACLLVASSGALILVPVLKILIGRARPVISHPLAVAPRNSFPSGHAFGSIACYGALLLVLLPALPERARGPVRWATVALIAAIGTTRVLLGVHFVSDVLAAWSLGVAWLGIVTYAFELSRYWEGRRVPQPLTEGLAPEAATELHPSQATPPRPSTALRAAAVIAVAWVLTLGALIGLGNLFAGYPSGNLLWDHDLPHFLAAHRSPMWTQLTYDISHIASTAIITQIALVAGAVAVGVMRTWRPAILLVLLVLGELTLFLAAQSVVKRPRPDVPQLESHLPTSSYPSGHVAVTAVLFVGLALLVIPRTQAWWRWLTLIPAVVLVPLMGFARMYRGMHHPTDVLGGLILAAMWIPVTYFTVRPHQVIRLKTSRQSETSSSQPQIRSSDVAAW